jgi:hypothetical protein
MVYVYGYGLGRASLVIDLAPWLDTLPPTLAASSAMRNRHVITGLTLVALSIAGTACRRSAPQPPPPTQPTAVSGSLPLPTSPMVGQPGQPVQPTPGAGAAVPAGQPVPAAQIAPVAATAGPLSITTSNPVLFRWTDGDWVARITVTVRNTGATPVDVDRSSFRLAEWTPWGGSTDFPDHTTVNPGLTIQGDIGWYISGGTPQPQSFTVNYAPGDDENAPVLATRTFTPVFSPAPPAHGAVPNALVYTLPVNVAQPGLTFIHTDGDRSVRIAVSITNNTGAPLSIPFGYFHAQVDGEDGTQWGPLTTLEDPINLAPGATASGTFGWYWSGAHGNPTAINFRFGPANSPQINSQIAVATGPSPIPQ